MNSDESHPQSIFEKFTTTQKFLKSFISGGFAGIAAKSAIAPFERIKILFVVTQRKFSYKEAFNDAKFIVSKHGYLAFWRGNVANILRIFPYSSIQFSTYDIYRVTFDANIPDDRPYMKKIGLFASGALAGMTASLLTYPLEFLRTRLAMQKDNFTYSNMRNAIKIIKKKEGLSSFYSGITITMAGIIPYHGVGFFCYRILKEKLKRESPQYSKHPFFDFLFGGFSALISQIISYPFDVLRKRMQAQRHFILEEDPNIIPKTTYQMLKYILKTEGVKLGLYKGISMNLIKGPISVGTVWTVKNSLNRYLDKDYDL